MKIFLSITCMAFTMLLTSCNRGPQPIRVGQDACDYCKMTIADNRFGAEIITKKGKVYKFDDAHCILAFRKANTVDINDIEKSYLVNFNEPHELLNATETYLLKSPDLRSPMGGNIAAFPDKIKLGEANTKFKGEEVNWNSLVNDKK